MKKSNLLKFAILGTILLIACVSCDRKIKPVEKPNIIYIFVDQQSESMMSCTGNRWLKTPAMDYIAENGIRFTRAYATNPVCSPSRVSLMTGRFAGAFTDQNGKQVRENDGSIHIPEISEEVKNSTIAAYLKKAGYELAYGGKVHLPKPLNPISLGFNVISNDQRDELAYKAAKYVKEEHQKPYFLVVSFINPHDICYMAIRDFSDPGIPLLQQGKTELAMLDSALQKPGDVSELEFFEKYCPPLPPNFETQRNEPKAINYLIDERDFKRKAREGYTEKDWRMHRWAYCRLTERVDSEVKIILDALKKSGQEENTLVIFSSDHGDMNAAHHMEHKTALYEESANIPFLAMWKGHIPERQVDSIHLVSNGLDLLPTVCDFAGISGSSDPRGRSLRPLFEGRDVDWRKTLGVESQIGRMVVSQDKFKYIKYDAVGIEEQLLDLNKDPYETTHFTNDPNDNKKLKELRKIFGTEWFPGY